MLLITTIDSASDISSVKAMTDYMLFIDFGVALGPLITLTLSEFVGYIGSFA